MKRLIGILFSFILSFTFASAKAMEAEVVH